MNSMQTNMSHKTKKNLHKSKLYSFGLKILGVMRLSGFTMYEDVSVDKDYSTWSSWNCHMAHKNCRIQGKVSLNWSLETTFANYNCLFKCTPRRLETELALEKKAFMNVVLFIDIKGINVSLNKKIQDDVCYI